MLDKVEILQILEQGKLRTFYVDASFIKVYYSYPELDKDSYYVFTFITANNKLFKTEIKYNIRGLSRPNKEYVPVIERMVKDLVADFNTGTKGSGEKF